MTPMVFQEQYNGLIGPTQFGSLLQRKAAQVASLSPFPQQIASQPNQTALFPIRGLQRSHDAAMLRHSNIISALCSLLNDIPTRASSYCLQ
jgi:hypothetical protein